MLTESAIEDRQWRLFPGLEVLLGKMRGKERSGPAAMSPRTIAYIQHVVEMYALVCNYQREVEAAVKGVAPAVTCAQEDRLQRHSIRDEVAELSSRLAAISETLQKASREVAHLAEAS